MRKNVISALKQDQSNADQQKDGMDISLTCIDLNNYMLQWSGAHNPLIVISNDELIEFKADKMPVGIYLKDDDFTLNEREMKHGDCIYMYSDGFIDQFGGPKSKKFLSKNLKELLLEIHTTPMENQKERLDTTITEWMACIDETTGEPHTQTDDICVWGIRLHY
jgi:serine phosphatase RsbU (regulator of sigma subunit)